MNTKLLEKKDKIVFDLFLLLFLSSLSAFSQEADGIELEGGIGGMKAGITYYLGGKYTSNLNHTIGISYGVMLNYASISENIKGHSYDGKSSALIGTLGVKFSTPVYRHFGITGDLNFMFEPLPWNVFTIDIGDDDDNDNTKTIYNAFNPGIGAQLGFFYEKDKTRFVLGGGIANYNPFCPYYKYAGVSVPHNDCLYSVFVRIYGLMD